MVAEERTLRMRAKEPHMPSNALAERATLGALLIHADAMPAIAAIVRIDDFYVEANRLIYQAALAVYEAGNPVDLITLTDYLRDHNQLESVGGVASVSTLTNQVPTSMHAEYYARIVAKHADQRRLVALWEDNALIGYDGETLPLDAITRVQEGLTNVSERILARQSQTGAAFFSAHDLMHMDFPEPHLIVAGLIPEGLTVLGGRPKMGKSWLSLNLALSVACGGPALGYTSTDAGDVLYLALEDTPPRLRDRVAQCMGDSPAPPALDFSVSCPRLDAGGLLLIESWLRRKAAPRMVIVDTLAMVRPESKGENANLYAQDYAAMSSLKKLADKHHIAVVVVHHLRKSGSASDDPLEELSGTNGISGAADNILVLKRPRGQDEGTLTAAGRDIEDTELAVRFDRSTGLWQVTGQASEVALTGNQKKVADAIKDAGCAITPKVIAEITGLNPNTVRPLVIRMTAAGKLVANEHGKYSLLTMGKLQ